MACKALAWLAVLGLVAPVGAQEGVESPREDLPDNMEEFRQTPLSDDTPSTVESEEQAGVGGSGMAGTGQQERRGEIHGEVVGVKGNQLLLRHGGAVFPLELTEDTRFTPDRRQALQAGQEVRARFTLEQEGYVVNALESVEQAPEERSSEQKQGSRQGEVPEG